MLHFGRRGTLSFAGEKRQTDPYGAPALILVMHEQYRIAAAATITEVVARLQVPMTRRLQRLRDSQGKH